MKNPDAPSVANAHEKGQMQGVAAVAAGSAFVRERRYFVIKLNDAQEFLTPAERAILKMLGDAVAQSRRMCGRRELQCVVVESDWPEYEPTWKAIEQRMAELNGPSQPRGENT